MSRGIQQVSLSVLRYSLLVFSHYYRPHDVFVGAIVPFGVSLTTISTVTLKSVLSCRVFVEMDQRFRAAFADRADFCLHGQHGR